MNYDALIKRAQNAIKAARMKESPACVHKVSVDTDITGLAGLVVILHPDYLWLKNANNE